MAKVNTDVLREVIARLDAEEAAARAANPRQQTFSRVGGSSRRASSRKKKKERKPVEEKKGGGGLLPDIDLGDVLTALDTPRSIVTSTIKESGDLVGGRGFSLEDWREQITDRDKRIYGSDFFEGHDWAPGWLRAGGGFALDVAADPLTYVGGVGVARGGTQSVANRIAQRAATDVAERAGRQLAPDLAQRIARGEATDLIDDATREVMKQHSSAVARARRGGVAALTDEEVARYGLRRGTAFKIPGGKERVIPGTATKPFQAVGRARRETVARAGDVLLGRGTPRRLGRLLPNAQLAARARAGDPEDALQATLAQLFKGTASQRQQALEESYGLAFSTAVKDATDEDLELVVQAINGNESALDELAQRNSKLKSEVDAVFAAAKQDAQRAGLVGEGLERGTYAPAVLSEQARDALRLSGLWPDEQFDDVGARSFFERARKLWDPETGEGAVGKGDAAVAFKAETRDEAVKKAEQIIRGKLDDTLRELRASGDQIDARLADEIDEALGTEIVPMFLSNPREAATVYFRNLSRRIAQTEAAVKSYSAGFGRLYRGGRGEANAFEPEPPPRFPEGGDIPPGPPLRGAGYGEDVPFFDEFGNVVPQERSPLAALFDEEPYTPINAGEPRGLDWDEPSLAPAAEAVIPAEPIVLPNGQQLELEALAEAMRTGGELRQAEELAARADIPFRMDRDKYVERVRGEIARLEDRVKNTTGRARRDAKTALREAKQRLAEQTQGTVSRVRTAAAQRELKDWDREVFKPKLKSIDDEIRYVEKRLAATPEEFARQADFEDAVRSTMDRNLIKLRRERDELQQALDLQKQLDLEDMERSLIERGEIDDLSFTDEEEALRRAVIDQAEADRIELSAPGLARELEERIAILDGQIAKEELSLANVVPATDPGSVRASLERTRNWLAKRRTALVRARGRRAQRVAQIAAEENAAMRAAPTALTPPTPGSALDEVLGRRLDAQAVAERTAELAEAANPLRPIARQWQEQLDPVLGTEAKSRFVSQFDVGGERFDAIAEAERLAEGWRTQAAGARDAHAAALRQLADIRAARTAIAGPNAGAAAFDQADILHAAVNDPEVAAASLGERRQLLEQAKVNGEELPELERSVQWGEAREAFEAEGDELMAEVARLNEVAESTAHTIDSAGGGTTGGGKPPSGGGAPPSGPAPFDATPPSGASERVRRLMAENIQQYIHQNSERMIAVGIATPADMADMLLSFDRVVYHTEGWKKTWQTWNSVTQWIKTWQIATPGFHLRNTFGGVFNNALAGVDAANYPRFLKTWRRAAKGRSLGKDAETWAQVESILTRGQAWYEPISTEGGGSAAAALIDRGAAKKHWLLPSRRNRYALMMQRAGGEVEFFLRGSLAYDVLKKGGTVDDAASAIAKFHFNYSDLSSFDQKVKRFIPFYTWTRKNVPLQVEQMFLNPKWYARYEQAKVEVERLSERDGLVPDWYADNLAIRLPWVADTWVDKDTGEVQRGHNYFFPDLPMRDLQRAVSPLSAAVNAITGEGEGSFGQQFVEGSSDFLSQVNPLVAGPIEWTFGRQAFKEIPLRDDRPVALDDLRIPRFLQEPLRLTPLVKKDPVSGRNYITERDLYIVDKVNPVLARVRRAISKEEKIDDRRTGWLLSTLLGTQVRSNTEEEQQTARYLQAEANKQDRGISRRLLPQREGYEWRYDAETDQWIQERIGTE